MLGRTRFPKQLIMKVFKIAILCGLGVSLISFTGKFIGQAVLASKESRVAVVLEQIGAPQGLHFIKELDSTKVRMGMELVLKGRTVSPSGKLTKRQSRYFVCTDCHNVVQEDPNLMNPNPEARLKYAGINGIPFLQGTTLYGVVNRKHWYNDDYLIKYGQLVAPTRDTLVNAVQLCATTCSQGRSFTNWELDAVMHYLNSIGLKMGDLNLTNKEEQFVINAIGTEESNEVAVLLESKYFQESHATFLDPISPVDRKLGADGNVQSGELIYKMSCLHCHKDGGVTNFKLSNAKLDFQFLRNHLLDNGNKSVYHITRKGTYMKNGYRPYMPNYTKERLSHQQLEDLIAFINLQSSK